MRIAFAGTPEFAALALDALVQAGHQVALVLTQPDRPAGRGLKMTASAVKQRALSYGFPIAQPEALNTPEQLVPLVAAQPELLVVAAYGLILPQAALAIAPLGNINIHASYLPRWRGAAPVQRAILAGDEQTGVTLMLMDTGLDTGPILRVEAETIHHIDTTASLQDRLARRGSRMLVSLLAQQAFPVPTPQPTNGVSYAAKIQKYEARLDWRKTANQLDRTVRAFNPAPGANFLMDGQAIKVWQAQTMKARGIPGTVLAVTRDYISVACGEDALQIKQLQRPGARRQMITEFIAAHPIEVGRVLPFPE